MSKKRALKGFTLAEVLITLVILGVVAAITVPSLLKRQTESANRTKIKKAWSIYDTAVQTMVLENSIKSKESLEKFGTDPANCVNTSRYFKIAEGSGCTFKTSEGVWWNIEEIMSPVISLTQEGLSDLENPTTFKFVTSFQQTSGAFRVNDIAYEKTINGATTDLEKLFSFINNGNSSEPEAGPTTSIFANCSTDAGSICKVTGPDGNEYTYEYKEFGNETVECPHKGQSWITTECDNFPSSVTAGDYYIIDSDLVQPTDAEAGENCNKAGGWVCDYWEAAKIKCENAGGHMANLAELKASGKADNGNFWASEEYGSSSAYLMYNGDVNSIVKDDDTIRVLCVGN